MIATPGYTSTYSRIYSITLSSQVMCEVFIDRSSKQIRIDFWNWILAEQSIYVLYYFKLMTGNVRSDKEVPDT